MSQFDTIFVMKFLYKIKNYCNFVKVEHTLFSLPLLFAGSILAVGHWPSWHFVGLIILAGAGARTAAFALNRIIDREIDARNPRTSQRELPAHKMSMKEGVGVGLVGASVYFFAAWKISLLCLALSPIPLIVFTIYPYLKRVTSFAHFGVGIANSLAPLGAYIASTGSLRSLEAGLLLSAFTVLWVAGFDVIYATQDEQFDRQAGLYSFPSDLGGQQALQFAAVCHTIAWMFLFILWVRFLSGWGSFTILCAIGAILIWQHRVSDQIELAFFKLNALLGFVLLGFIWVGVKG